MSKLTLLYKYLDCGGIKVLENRTLRGSDPSTLNDPFELMPGLLPLSNDEILRSIASEDVLIDVFWEMKKDKQGSKEQFRDRIRQDPEFIVRYFRERPKAEDEIYGQFCKGRGDYRMLCFSLRNDGILMWAHYADHHKGFVLGFDKAPLDAGFPADQRFPVEYRSARPCIGNLLDVFRSGISEELNRSVRTKSLEWAYEEEYRLFGEKTTDGNNDSTFDPRMLRQVIFGSRCLPKLEARIRELLAQPEYKYVRKSKAVLSDREFKIEVEDE